MDWIVFGNLDFLADILNGIAAMFSPFSGGATNSYSGLVSIAALLGVLLMIVHFVFSGGEMPMRKFIIALAVYGLSFGPTTTVTMQNVYTSGTRTISNVPLAIGFTGMLFSRIGSSMATLFETAYSFPGMTEDGFLEAMDTWRIMRGIASDPSTYAIPNTVAGSNFSESWRNYISTCVAFALESGQLDMRTVKSARSVIGALNVENHWIGARINTGAGWEDLSCFDAHAQLRVYSQTTFLPAFEEQTLLPRMTTEGHTTFHARGRFDRMLNVFNIMDTRETVMLSLLLGDLYYQGIHRRLSLDGKTAQAIMFSDAIRQRNAQWDGQAALFREYAQPVLTFIEGFFYGMAPLMMVLLVLSVAGLSIIYRYLMIGLWIQFWFPVASLVHLFIYHVVAGDIANLNSTGYAMSSLGGQYDADDVVQTWMGVAGLFVSSIPVLALLVLSGSVYTFQGVASSISGPDTVNENAAAPKTLDAAPRMMIPSAMEVHPQRGMVAPDANGILPTYSVSKDTSGRVSSSERELEGARNSFMQSVSQNYARSVGTETRATDGQFFNQSVASQNSDLYRIVNSESAGLVTDFANRYGISESTVGEMATRFTASGGLAAGGRGRNLGVNAAKNYAMRSVQSMSEDRATNIARDLGERLSTDQDMSSSLTQALASDVQRGLQKSGYNSEVMTDSHELRQSAESFRAKEASYESAVSEQQSAGNMQTLDTPYLSHQIAGDRPSYDNLMRIMAHRGLMGQTQNLARSWMHDGFFPRDSSGEMQAQAGAALAVLSREGQDDALRDALSPHGVYVPDIGNAHANRGIGSGSGSGVGGGVDFAATRARLGSEVGALQANYHAVTGGDAVDAVFEQSQANNTRISEASANAHRGHVAAASEGAVARIEVPEPSTLDTVSNALGIAGAAMSPGGMDAHYDALRQQGLDANLTEEQAAYFATRSVFQSTDLLGPADTTMVEMALGAKQSVMEGASLVIPEVQSEITQRLNAAAADGPDMADAQLRAVGELNRKSADDTVAGRAMRKD